jgi:hypothetical protein
VRFEPRDLLSSEEVLIVRDIVPILLGEGKRLYDNPDGDPIRAADGTMAEVNVRYRPAREEDAE